MIRKLSLLLTLTLVTACQAPSKPANLDQAVGASLVSSRELRAQLNEYMRDFTAEVQAAADEIIERAEETTVRKEAMRWKMEGVPACQLAVFKEDPAAALLDTWALAAQMTRYFESGRGSGYFGKWQGIAVETSKCLEAGVETLAQTLSDPDQAKAQVLSWVEEHPVHGSLLNRPTTAPMIASVFGDRSSSAMASIGNLDQRIAQVLERMDIYVESLPTQFRWQAEYIIEQQLVSQEERRQALTDVEEIAEGMDRVAILADDMPRLIEAEREEIRRLIKAERKEVEAILDRQRDRVTETIDRQRELTFSSITAEREEILSALEAERAAILAMVEKERKILLQAVTEEREALLAAVDAQRVATLTEGEAIVARSIAESARHGRSLIRRVLVGGGVVGAGLIVLLGLAGFLLIRVAKERRLTESEE
jgi:hypothetical protein